MHIFEWAMPTHMHSCTSLYLNTDVASYPGLPRTHKIKLGKVTPNFILRARGRPGYEANTDAMQLALNPAVRPLGPTLTLP